MTIWKSNRSEAEPKRGSEVIGHCPKLVTTPNSGGETPLHAAARTGEAEMVGLILAASDDVEDSGAMLRARDADARDTALHVAVRHGFSAVAELLLGRHMDDQLCLRNLARESPLLLVVE